MTTLSSPLASQAVQEVTNQDLSQITSTLYISNGAAANNQEVLSSNRITSVINATKEVVNTVFDNIRYVQIPVEDSPTAYLYTFFDPVADHIHNVELKFGRTLLHCAAGVSRSPSLCMAYLMKYHSMSLLDAHTWTKLCRPVIRPNDGFWEQLIYYEFRLFNKNTVPHSQLPEGFNPQRL